MKKNIFKIAASIVILSGFFITNQAAFAACAKTNYHTVKFDPLTLSRTGTALKLKTKVTFEDSKCSGPVFDALKDFSFEYTTAGFDNWSEIDIPDSSVPINYNVPIELSVLMPETLNKNAVFEGKFTDNNKDVSSTLSQFWVDKANFDYIDIKTGSITSDSIEFDGSVKYENNGAASAGKNVPSRNIVARIYKKDGSLWKEVAFNNTATLKYNQVLPLYLKVTTLTPDTEYSIRFFDKNRTSTDASFSKPFKTLKKPASTTAGSTTSGGASTPTTSGTPTGNSNTTSTITTTTLTAEGQQEFSIASKAYPGITMDGSLTPTVEGGDLSIQGSFVYNYATTPISGLSRGGSLSFHLVDGDGYSSQIVPIDVVATGDEVEYKKPYFFSPGFDNYVKFLDEDGKPVTTERKAPFSIVITDDGLGMVSAKIPVVDAVTSTTIAGISQNGAFSGATQTGQTSSGTATPQSATTPAAANGSKVTFTVTNSEFTPPGLLNVVVTAAYTKPTSGTTPAAKNITGTLFDNKGAKIMDVPADIYKNKPNNFEISFIDVDPAKGPFTMTLKDNDLGVSATGFKLATIDPATLNNAGDPAKDPATKSSFGLFQNPLRKGLDSIPEIVSALVKNIVIPIAVPFLALAIIYTGFLFIQARGNKDKLEKAKEALKWTLIGGAIILAAYVIATALQGTIADIIR